MTVATGGHRYIFRAKGWRDAYSPYHWWMEGGNVGIEQGIICRAQLQLRMSSKINNAYRWAQKGTGAKSTPSFSSVLLRIASKRVQVAEKRVREPTG